MKINIINNRYTVALSVLLLLGGAGEGLLAQERAPHTTQYQQLFPLTYTQIDYRTMTDISDPTLMPESPFVVGMDVAWDSEDNVVRGTNYIGKDVLRIGRVSFQPSDTVVNGELTLTQKRALQYRLNHIAKSGVKDLILNCDHEVLCNKDNYPNCDQNYANYHEQPERWLAVIKATVNYVKSKGYNVITISPFNEPDYTNWKEGTKDDFKAIAKLISEDPDLAGIRISAGNTLNCDQAYSWYNYMKPYVQEGNTHQLAGSFDNYVSFWQNVRKDGNYATADEMHNVGEAFIGVHYGLQAGVWWGWDGQARAEFCHSAFYGKEIGYGENRTNWGAACVYKRQDGRMDAFLGMSERQAVTTDFVFNSLDQDVFYNGYGPMRSYAVQMPGGNGYSKNQPNCERMIQIHCGEDVPFEPIQPGGSYLIINNKSGKCFGMSGGLGNAKAITTSSTPTAKYNQWHLQPIDNRLGGDCGYWYIKNLQDTTYVIDIKDWSKTTGGTIINYQGGLGTNEQWAFEYAGKGAWYIRSRHSGLYLEVKDGSMYASAVIQQNTLSGDTRQRWRLIPINTTLDTKAPEAPTGLKATAQSGSVRLEWTANNDADLAGYMLYRGLINGSDTTWTCIGRMLDGTCFIDNGACGSQNYAYRVKAVDQCRNLSAASEVASLLFEPAPGLVAHYACENNLLDETDNCLDALSPTKPLYLSLCAKQGDRGISMVNSESTVNKSFLQLPVSVASYRNFTFAAWVYLMGTGSDWQRIFDFGNGTDQYLFLTPNSSHGDMRFVMKNGGDEEILSATRMSSGWHHVAVTIGNEAVTLYVDGSAAATSTTMTIRPSDIRPQLNYIGRSQFTADPYFKGYIDDIRLYNCALPADEITRLMNGGEAESGIRELLVSEDEGGRNALHNLSGQHTSANARGLLITNGKVIFKK